MRVLLMVLAVGMIGSVASADKIWKIPPTLCEQKILGNAVNIKMEAKETLRGTEDLIDNQIDSGNVTGIPFEQQQEYNDARFLLDEIRRLQNGQPSTGALERFCKKGLFEKPEYY